MLDDKKEFIYFNDSNGLLYTRVTTMFNDYWYTEVNKWPIVRFNQPIGNLQYLGEL